MPIHINNEEYIDDLGETLSHEFFYNQLKEGGFPSTSQINTHVFLEHYQKSYNNDEAIIYLGLSSGLSGTYNNAMLAKSMFLEEQPDAKISVIDTVAASGGLGALVAQIVELIKQGKELDEIVEWIIQNYLKINHWFAIDDLEHLKKGGRIPAAMALVGTALKVKPILTVAHDGKLKAYASVRGRQKSIQYLFKKFEEHIGVKEQDKIVFICHAHCIDDALKLKQLISKHHNPKKIIITELSATIGAHVGLGMLAVAFLGDEIRENR